jgi:hypothetical protein
MTMKALKRFFSRLFGPKKKKKDASIYPMF